LGGCTSWCLAQPPSPSVLVNPANANAENQSKELEQALRPSVRTRAGAVLVAADPFYFIRRERLIALAARHSMPAIYDFRAYAEAGSLASYGTHLAEASRQVGIYAGRILRGEQPADLPGHAVHTVDCAAAEYQVLDLSDLGLGVFGDSLNFLLGRTTDFF